jgi:hypothetical protein
MPVDGLVGTAMSDVFDSLDWAAVRESLNTQGYAITPPLLCVAECSELMARYDDDAQFRSTIVMARHRFGEGCYRYFDNPMPGVVSSLRTQLYAALAPIANDWQKYLGVAAEFPSHFDAYQDACHRAGQTRPTPLLLRYEAGGYNCLHQDKYGDLAFPLQVTCLLTETGQDFDGGEFLLIENRSRTQSRGSAITLERGQCIIFPNQVRPVPGTRGYHRVQVRHGVSTVHRGVRMALGIIFHDAA